MERGCASGRGRRRPGPEVIRTRPSGPPRPWSAAAAARRFVAVLPRRWLAAGGPAAAPRLQSALRVDAVGDVDLLGLARLAGVGSVGAAAGTDPGLDVELQAAVVAVAAVDGPVAAGLALGDLVPHAGIHHGRGCGSGVPAVSLGRRGGLGRFLGTDRDLLGHRLAGGGL